MRLLYRTVAIVLGFCSLGCGVFSETRYLVTVKTGAQGQPDQPINWLKVDIRGSSGFSSARYLSDFFDASAVDSFFGTYVQPSGAQFPSTQPANRTELVGVSGQGGKGSEFILLLSTNADAFADAVGSYAQSESIAADIVRLANKDQYLKSYGKVSQSIDTATQATETAKRLVVSGDKLLSGIDPKDPETARQSVLAFANQLAAATGHGTRYRAVTQPTTTQSISQSAQEGK